MSSRHPRLVVVVAAILTTALPLDAQAGSSCRLPTDPLAPELHAWVSGIATLGSEPFVSMRESTSIPFASADSVVILGDTTSTGMGACYYLSKHSADFRGLPTTARHLAVVRIQGIYVVLDPADHWGQLYSVAVMRGLPTSGGSMSLLGVFW